MGEYISSIPCILLVILVSVVPVLLPRFFHIQPSLGLCILYYLYFGHQVLNCFPYLFDCFFLVFLGIFEGFIISSNFLFVFSSISLREFFTSCLRVSIIFIRLLLKSISSNSYGLGCSSLAVACSLDCGVMLLFRLLEEFLHRRLPISSTPFLLSMGAGLLAGLQGP